MGIQGLLPVLKSVTDDVHVREYAGLAVGIDTLCWLHKAVYGCATQLALGQPTSFHINYCRERLDLLLAHGVRPLFVFDGAPLPAKAGTEAQRRADRAKARAEGEAAHASGDKAGAHAAFSRAVDVSPQLAYGFIALLRQRGVPFIVAPYEADAQLAYLARQGIIAAVISEDSDMVAHAVPRTCFKMQRDGGGKEVALARLPACEELSLGHWSAEMVLNMCILAGCDYLPSLPGVGIKGAHDLVRRTRTTERLLAMLRFEHAARMPEGYEAGLARARLTFLHQRVWDPRERRLTTVTPLPPGIDAASGELDFLGPWLPQGVAEGIATGVLDPSTMQPYLPVAAAPAGGAGGGPGAAGSSGGPQRGLGPAGVAGGGMARLPGQPHPLTQRQASAPGSSSSQARPSAGTHAASSASAAPARRAASAFFGGSAAPKPAAAAQSGGGGDSAAAASSAPSASASAGFSTTSRPLPAAGAASPSGAALDAFASSTLAVSSASAAAATPLLQSSAFAAAVASGAVRAPRGMDAAAVAPLIHVAAPPPGALALHGSSSTAGAGTSAAGRGSGASSADAASSGGTCRVSARLGGFGGGGSVGSRMTVETLVHRAGTDRALPGDGSGSVSAPSCAGFGGSAGVALPAAHASGAAELLAEVRRQTQALQQQQCAATAACGSADGAGAGAAAAAEGMLVDSSSFSDSSSSSSGGASAALMSSSGQAGACDLPAASGVLPASASEVDAAAAAAGQPALRPPSALPGGLLELAFGAAWARRALQLPAGMAAARAGSDAGGATAGALGASGSGGSAAAGADSRNPRIADSGAGGGSSSVIDEDALEGTRSRALPRRSVPAAAGSAPALQLSGPGSLAAFRHAPPSSASPVPCPVRGFVAPSSECGLGVGGPGQGADAGTGAHAVTELPQQLAADDLRCDGPGGACALRCSGAADADTDSELQQQLVCSAGGSVGALTASGAGSSSFLCPPLGSPGLSQSASGGPCSVSSASTASLRSGASAVSHASGFTAASFARSASSSGSSGGSTVISLQHRGTASRSSLGSSGNSSGGWTDASSGTRPTSVGRAAPAPAALAFSAIQRGNAAGKLAAGLGPGAAHSGLARAAMRRSVGGQAAAGHSAGEGSLGLSQFAYRSADSRGSPAAGAGRSPQGTGGGGGHQAERLPCAAAVAADAALRSAGLPRQPDPELQEALFGPPAAAGSTAGETDVAVMGEGAEGDVRVLGEGAEGGDGACGLAGLAGSRPLQRCALMQLSPNRPALATGPAASAAGTGRQASPRRGAAGVVVQVGSKRRSGDVFSRTDAGAEVLTLSSALSLLPAGAGAAGSDDCSVAAADESAAGDMLGDGGEEPLGRGAAPPPQLKRQRLLPADSAAFDPTLQAPSARGAAELSADTLALAQQQHEREGWGGASSGVRGGGVAAARAVALGPLSAPKPAEATRGKAAAGGGTGVPSALPAAAGAGAGRPLSLLHFSRARGDGALGGGGAATSHTLAAGTGADSSSCGRSGALPSAAVGAGFRKLGGRGALQADVAAAAAAQGAGRAQRGNVATSRSSGTAVQRTAAQRTAAPRGACVADAHAAHGFGVDLAEETDADGMGHPRSSSGGVGAAPSWTAQPPGQQLRFRAADGASSSISTAGAVGAAGGHVLGLQAYACPSAGAGRGFGSSAAASAEGRAAAGTGAAAAQPRETARALAMLFPPPPLPRPGVNACPQPAAPAGAPAQVPPPQQQQQGRQGAKLAAAGGQHAGDARGDRRTPGGSSAHWQADGTAGEEGGAERRGRFGAAVSAWYGGSLAAIQLKPWRSAYGGGGGDKGGAAGGGNGEGTEGGEDSHAYGDASAAAGLGGSEGQAKAAGNQQPPLREGQQQAGESWRGAHMLTELARLGDPMARGGGGEEQEEAGQEEGAQDEGDAWAAAERLLARGGRSSPGPAPSQADMWQPLQRRRHPSRPEATPGAAGACERAPGAAEGDKLEVQQRSGFSPVPAGASASSAASSSSLGAAAGPGVRRAVRLQGLERPDTAAGAGEEARPVVGASRGREGSVSWPDDCPHDAPAAHARGQQAAEGAAAANESRFVTQLPAGAIVLHRPRPPSAAGAAAPAARCGGEWDAHSPRDAAIRAASPGLDDDDAEEEEEEEGEGAADASAAGADSGEGAGSGSGELRSRTPPRDSTLGDCASADRARRGGACADNNCTASSAGGLSILFGDAAAAVVPARAAALLDAPEAAAASGPLQSGLAAGSRDPEACTRYDGAAGASGIQFSPPRPGHTS